MYSNLLLYVLFILNINNVYPYVSYTMSMPLDRRNFVYLTSGAASNIFFNNYEKPICIIGANGETGRECLKILDDSKQSVKALSRKPINLDELEIKNKNLIKNINFDMRDKNKLDKEMKDVSSVIFLANAKKKYPYFKSDFEGFQNYDDIDVYALKNVVNNCIKYKINRLIYVSGSCRSCSDDESSSIDKLCGIECENCRSKQNAEKIIKNAYKNVNNGIDYTIIRIGYLINGEKRNVSDLEINQDYTKSGMISRIDLANLCLNSIDNTNTARTTFEAYYKDTTQPYDVKESLKKCRNLGKSVEECFFGSEFKETKPKDLEEVRKTPIKGSLFTTGKEYSGDSWTELFKDLKKDSFKNSNFENDRLFDDIDNNSI